MALKEYRVTKYDLPLRDSDSTFTASDWMRFSVVVRGRRIQAR